jgi:hypothetical protein
MLEEVMQSLTWADVPPQAGDISTWQPSAINYQLSTIN